MVSYFSKGGFISQFGFEVVGLFEEEVVGLLTMMLLGKDQGLKIRDG